MTAPLPSTSGRWDREDGGSGLVFLDTSDKCDINWAGPSRVRPTDVASYLSPAKCAQRDLRIDDSRSMMSVLISSVPSEGTLFVQEELHPSGHGAFDDRYKKANSPAVDKGILKIATERGPNNHLAQAIAAGTEQHAMGNSNVQLSSALPLYRSALTIDSTERLLCKFDRHTCGILSLRNGIRENPWRTIMWPLAQQCPALLHAINSMTAFHSAKSSPRLRIAGMEHKVMSIDCLASAMNSMPVHVALATALSLAFAESWDMHISTGAQHLKGARVLIGQILSRDSDNASWTVDRQTRFLCYLWVYMDVIARLTSYDAPEFDAVDAALWSYMKAQPSAEEIDPLMGCATTLFPIIGQVATLISKVKLERYLSFGLVNRASELRSSLEAWEPPANVLFPEDPNCDIRHALNTAEAYRWATLLYLHQACPEIPAKPASYYAENALGQLAAVPLTSRTVIVHIYPLLAAGCEMVKDDDQEWVSQRWTAMSHVMQLGNVDRCYEITREVWRRRKQSALTSTVTVVNHRATPPETCLSETLQPRSGEGHVDCRGSAWSCDDFSWSTKSYACNTDIDTIWRAGSISAQTTLGSLQTSHVRDLHAQEILLAPINTERSCKDKGERLPFGNAWNPSSDPGSYLDGDVDRFGVQMQSAGEPRTWRSKRVTGSALQTAQDLSIELTVRGKLHWSGVMRDWNWEGTLGFSETIPGLVRGFADDEKSS